MKFQTLFAEMSGLSEKANLIVGYKIAATLYPNFKAFTDKNHWGDVAPLVDALAVIRKNILDDESIDAAHLADLLSKVDATTPDTEDFPGLLASFALDACVVIISSLSFMRDSNRRYLLDVLDAFYDTLSLYIQEKEGIEPVHATETAIDSHALMIEQFASLSQLVHDLKSPSTSKAATVEKIENEKLTLDLDGFD